MQRDGAEHGSAAQEAPGTVHPLAQPAETRRRSAAEESPEREIERAIQLAYRAVGYRERTVAELRTFLERKRVEPCAIEEAVAELRTSGLLDDARYAQRFAQDKRELDRWGSERIARDLHKRGIAPDLVESAIATTSRDSELATALLLLEQRLPPPRDDRARDRAWRLLIRRGYEPELAYEAVRRYEHSGSHDERRAAEPAWSAGHVP